jgi:hypothetical protein
VSDSNEKYSSWSLGLAKASAFIFLFGEGETTFEKLDNGLDLKLPVTTSSASLIPKKELKK